MIKFRVQINPRRGGRYLGGGAAVIADSVEAAIRPLDALPGDALWVEAVADDERLVFEVQDGDGGLCAVAT